jgi:predicted ATP-dependent serine protease
VRFGRTQVVARGDPRSIDGVTQMTQILCTECGHVGEPQAGRCAKCGGTTVLPADAPAARRFIEQRQKVEDSKAEGAPLSVRAEATGKVFGRILGKLTRR